MAKKAEAFTTRDRGRAVASPTQQPMTPRLITIKHAAEYCSCSVWAIRQAIWSRELPACMIGKRYLIDRADLDAFIDARIRDRAS
ncbi:MAG: helix-turn-helix domain-containing protein [Terriglobales bacterium]